MNPIAKKLLYSTLGGAAPGALVGAAVSEEDNRLRNALIGAGLGGAAGAGIYSAKRLGDVNDLNKVYDDLLSERPVASTMDALEDLRMNFLNSSKGVETRYLVGNISNGLLDEDILNSSYKLVDPSTGADINLSKRLLPFTEADSVIPRLRSQKGNIHSQYDPGSKRTYFSINDAHPGYSGEIEPGRITGLQFSIPGEASGLFKQLNTDRLDEVMKSLDAEADLKNLSNLRLTPTMRAVNPVLDKRPRSLIDYILTGNSEGIKPSRKTLNLSPKFNEGTRGTFFQDPSMPYFDEVPVVLSEHSSDLFTPFDVGPKVLGRLEKRSSLKLRGKSRLRQALINAASASRR